MKKVCIFNLNAYALFNPKSAAPLGGAEVDMFLVGQALKESCEVHFVVGNWGQSKKQTIDNILVHRSVSLGGKGYLVAAISIWRLLRQINADVYISSSAGPEVGLIALFCKVSGKKYIYRTASAIDVNGQYIRGNGLAGLAYAFGLKRANKVVVTVKQHRGGLMKKHKIKSEKIEYIPLALPESKQAEVKKDTILWVSRCVALKNPDIFLDLALSLPKESFTMIAPPIAHEQELFKQIKDRASHLPNVTFIPFVPFDQIQTYFDRAKVFINTSDYEGFTLTLLQSGRAKTPVIYLNIDPDNVIKKYKIGVYASGDTQQLRSSLVNLLENKTSWNRASEAICQYVFDKHNFNVAKQAWNALVG